MATSRRRRVGCCAVAVAIVAGIAYYWTAPGLPEIAPADPARLDAHFAYVRSLPVSDDKHDASRQCYVDGQRGDDGWDGSAPTYLGASHGPWKTLARASGGLSPGTTLLIRAGTYHEVLRPEQAGVVDAPITYAAYSDERVLITRMADLGNCSHVTLRGLRFHSPDGTGWLRTDAQSHHIVIRQCLFDNAASHFQDFATMHLEGHHLTLRQNVFGRGTGDMIHAPRVRDLLVENNDFSQAAADHALIAAVGEAIVIRGNFFRNPWARALHLCWNGAQPTRQVLVEDNVFVDCDWNRASPHPVGRLADRGSAETVRFLVSDGIFRNNLLIGCNQGNDWPMHATISFQTFHARWYDSRHYERLRLYHNTLFRNQTTGVIFTKNTDDWHLDDLVFQNNILAGCAGPAIRVDVPGIPWHGYRYRFENNLLAGSGAALVHLHDAGGDQSLAAAQQNFPTVFRDNREAPTQFRDGSLLAEVVARPEQFGLRDLSRLRAAFTLTAASPGHGAASALTTTTAPSNDASVLRVGDARCFGAGCDLIGGDAIMLGDAAVVVRRMIDGQTLEIDRRVSVPAGTAIYLQKAGKRADIGINR